MIGGGGVIKPITPTKGLPAMENTKLGKLSQAYDMAKTGPKIHVHVYHGGTMGEDSKWRKEEKARKIATVKALKAKLDNFDREKAADAVYGSLLREHKRAQLEVDGGYDGEDF